MVNFDYQERVFHTPENAPSDDAIRRYLKSDKCPLNQFTGNKVAVDMLRSIAFQAWQNPNHAVLSKATGRVEKVNIALLGGAGLGKTTLGKLFSQTVMLPFVELRKVKDTQKIFDAIKEELQRTGIPLNHNGVSYVCPPCVVFIDEVHDFAGKARRSSTGIMNDLLKATEPDDSQLVNQGKWVLDCTNICWIVATTEWFMLPKPFRDRFEKVELLPYTDQESTQIVMKRFPALPIKIAGLASSYGKNIPRLAIGCAKLFSLEKDWKDVSWEDAAKEVAEQRGIDEYGMDRHSISILSVLGRNLYTSTGKLSSYSGYNEIELQEMLLPPLVNPPVGTSFIRHTRKGWMLLPSGVEELKKRGLPVCNEIVAYLYSKAVKEIDNG